MPIVNTLCSRNRSPDEDKQAVLLTFLKRGIPAGEKQVASAVVQKALRYTRALTRQKQARPSRRMSAFVSNNDPVWIRPPSAIWRPPPCARVLAPRLPAARP